MLTKNQLKHLRSVPQVDTGSRMRAALEMCELTQLAVAAGTGFAQPYISAVCRGVNSDITVSNARTFAAYFGCLIEDLFPPVERKAA